MQTGDERVYQISGFERVPLADLALSVKFAPFFATN
jgi:hypothetical protein